MIGRGERFPLTKLQADKARAVVRERKDLDSNDPVLTCADGKVEDVQLRGSRKRTRRERVGRRREVDAEEEHAEQSTHFLRSIIGGRRALTGSTGCRRAQLLACWMGWLEHFRLGSGPGIIG